MEFKTLTEKRIAIENYINSKDFANYIKYGYTNKTYFYKGMLLIDYIKLNYNEVLKTQLKTPNNLYDKIIRTISNHWDIDSLSLEEIEQLISEILKSDEIKIYLNKKKNGYEIWTYNNGNLKEVILEIFNDIIEDDFDLYRIYSSITRNARKLKLENPEMDNNNIISYFLTEEFVKNYKEEYTRKKAIKEEIEKKANLYSNRDDFDYICLYATDNYLDIDEINRIRKQGFNYYSAIIILEYSLKYNTPVDELINFTLNVDESSNNYLLWLFKLGFRDSINDVLEKNKKLINLWIYSLILTIFNGPYNINFEDIYSFLTELLITKHIGITVSKDNLFLSFKSFTKSCIKRYLLEMKHKDNQFKDIHSLDDENFYIQLPSNDNIEDDYIDSEENIIINDAIDKLDDLEKEFIDLRYGFSGNPNDLHKIKKILESKGLLMSLEELEQMDIDVLDKLRNNPNILTLNRKL